MHSVRDTPKGGLPHSEIPGSQFASNSPGLIAGCHVFHRLSTPSHSPCALTGLVTPTGCRMRSLRTVLSSDLHMDVPAHARLKSRDHSPDARRTHSRYSSPLPLGRRDVHSFFSGCQCGRNSGRINPPSPRCLRRRPCPAASSGGGILGLPSTTSSTQYDQFHPPPTIPGHLRPARGPIPPHGVAAVSLSSGSPSLYEARTSSYARDCVSSSTRRCSTTPPSVSK